MSLGCVSTPIFEEITIVKKHSTISFSLSLFLPKENCPQGGGNKGNIAELWRFFEIKEMYTHSTGMAKIVVLSTTL